MITLCVDGDIICVLLFTHISYTISIRLDYRTRSKITQCHIGLVYNMFKTTHASFYNIYNMKTYPVARVAAEARLMWFGSCVRGAEGDSSYWKHDGCGKQSHGTGSGPKIMVSRHCQWKSSLNSMVFCHNTSTCAGYRVITVQGFRHQCQSGSSARINPSVRPIIAIHTVCSFIFTPGFANLRRHDMAYMEVLLRYNIRIIVNELDYALFSVRGLTSL